MSTDIPSNEHERAAADLRASFPELIPQSTPGWNISYGAGWHRILVRLMASIQQSLNPEQLRRFRIVQIKQKWGELRVYFQVDDRQDVVLDLLYLNGRQKIVDQAAVDGFPIDKVRLLIADAASEAARVCEQCGKPGVLRQGGWIRVLCGACQAARKQVQGDLD